MKKLEEGPFEFILYGIHVKISGVLADKLAEDFAYFQFQKDQSWDYSVQLEIDFRPYSLDDTPNSPAERVFSECVMYREDRRYIFEYPQAILTFERQSKKTFCKLVSNDERIIHERGYLFLQSEIGQILDKKGLHRIHALGFCDHKGHAVVLLLPSGGGKSTLAIQILASGGRLLSDDSPLIDRRGFVLPYPLRLGFKEGVILPENWRPYTINFDRQKWGRKQLVSVRALSKKSLPPETTGYKPTHLIVGRRHGGQCEPRLVPIRRREVLGALFRDLIVGLGTAQVIEMVLTEGVRSLIKMLPRFFSRTWSAVRLCLGSSPYRFEMSRDPKRNAAFLLEHLAQSSEKSR